MSENAKKTCFVISPIGAENSDTRKLADDVLELIVEPALQPFGFTIVRADKISRPSIITSDVIKFVQTSELCIIDLTGHNPNVFYECGRRHENGLPFIQIIRKGETLPFDVSVIRTIAYDLSHPRSVLTSIRELQEFIKTIESYGYGGGSTGDSLSSIADGITRIERTINQFFSEIIWKADKSKKEQEITKDLMTKHPITAFNEAFNNGNVDLAINILPRIKRLIGKTDWLRCLSLLAQAGEPEAETTLIDAVNDDEITSDLLIEGIYGLQLYYNNRNMQKDGIIKLQRLYDGLTKKHKFTDVQLANFLGYIQVFQFQIGEYEESIRTGLEVLKKDRSAVSLANLAHAYFVMNRSDEAASYIDEYVDLPDATAFCFDTAYEVYKALGRNEDAERVIEKKAKLNM